MFPQRVPKTLVLVRLCRSGACVYDVHVPAFMQVRRGMGCPKGPESAQKGPFGPSVFPRGNTPGNASGGAAVPNDPAIIDTPEHANAPRRALHGP